MFFWNSSSCFFYYPTDVGNLISGSSAFSKTSLNIWNFTVYVLLKPGLENFQHYFTSMWDECNCAIVWAFFGIASPITSWQIDGKTMETVRFYFLGLQNHCGWWLQPWYKKMLACWRKAMTNLDSVLKSRDITLPTKICIVKVMVFPVVMYGCESWTVKKAEAEELMFLNCGAGEDSWESLGLQGDPTSPFWRRSALGVLWKEWC